MSCRSLLLVLPLALPGCQPSSDQGDTATASNAASIPCALAGAATFKSDCTIEKTASADGLVLTIHHADGGFRRLLVTTDGRGVVPFDGSQPASVAVIAPGTIEVGIEGDRYRLPATVKGQTQPGR